VLVTTARWLFQQVGQAGTRVVLGVADAKTRSQKLEALFNQLHHLTDVAEIVRRPSAWELL
jgi:hypothetical protein